MIRGACHCGRVTFSLSSAPTQVTSCNCSICKRLSPLWAYYEPADVVISGEDSADRYMWGEGSLAFVRCSACGCLTHWAPLRPGARRMGVNARMLEGIDLAAIPVRMFDGASM